MEFAYDDDVLEVTAECPTAPAGLKSSPWRDIVLAARAGRSRIRVRCHQPGYARHGVVVWAHGGSWTGGSIEAWHEPCAALAAASGMAVLGVDYRLAPRWPFPAPLQDLMRVLHWAATAFTTPDAGPPMLVVGGDSAGATLAASAAVRCRDEGLALASQVLAYPPLDPSCSLPSYRRQPQAYPSRDLMLDAWASYRGAARTPPAGYHLTPWSVGDLSGLPTAILGVGENDPVADDSLAFAERLAGQGNEVTLRSFTGAGHGLFFHQAADGSFPLQEWIAECLHERLATWNAGATPSC